jgi:hypothetical protein
MTDEMMSLRTLRGEGNRRERDGRIRCAAPDRVGGRKPDRRRTRPKLLIIDKLGYLTNDLLLFQARDLRNAAVFPLAAQACRENSVSAATCRTDRFLPAMFCARRRCRSGGSGFDGEALASMPFTRDGCDDAPKPR